MGTSIHEQITVDVLQEIFAWAVFLDNTTSVRSRCVIRVGRAPILLSWVCSQWRAIAIGTPGLWSNLELETYQLLHKKSAKELYRMWMDRSSPYSLSVYISEDYYTSAQITENRTIVAFLLECATRCRYLHLSGPRVCGGVLRELSQTEIQFPHLEGLFLSSGFFGSPTLEESMSAVQFPKLRQLGITGIADNCGLEYLVHLHNPDMTHLSCDSYFFERLRLERPPMDFVSLVELDVLLLNWSYVGDRNSDPTIERHLDFPQLRILAVYESFYLTRTAAFLRNIGTPQLNILKIVGDPMSSANYLDSSQDFAFLEEFVGQAPRLRRLELSHNSFHSDHFLQNRPSCTCIRQVPFVQICVTVQIRHHCWTHHGEVWKKKGMDVVFEVDQGQARLAQFKLTMLVGWAKFPLGSSLGTREVSDWKTSFWAGEAGKDYRYRRTKSLVAM